MKEQIDYLELAKDFFLKLKRELQNEDYDSMGGASSKDYDIDGIKFTIYVDGFWEKAKFFDYKVKDEFGNTIVSDNYCF